VFRTVRREVTLCSMNTKRSTWPCSRLACELGYGKALGAGYFEDVVGRFTEDGIGECGGNII